MFCWREKHYALANDFFFLLFAHRRRKWCVFDDTICLLLLFFSLSFLQFQFVLHFIMINVIRIILHMEINNLPDHICIYFICLCRVAAKSCALTSKFFNIKHNILQLKWGNLVKKKRILFCLYCMWHKKRIEEISTHCLPNNKFLRFWSETCRSEHAFAMTSHLQFATFFFAFSFHGVAAVKSVFQK